ncbi:MAG: GyrI-like domain-containing protein [Bacillota bacterium]
MEKQMIETEGAMDMRYVNEPIIEERSDQPYVGVSARISSDVEEAPELAAEVLAWLRHHKEVPTGLPFIRYWCLDDDGQRFIEVGIPTKRLLTEDDRMVTGYLPGGAFVRAVHNGPPKELWASSEWLVDWLDREGLSAALRYEGETKIWDAYMAFFVTDPFEKTTQDAWTIELCILLLGDNAA